MRDWARPIVLLSLALLLCRLFSMVLVGEPGYTDAYYYSAVAGRLARGDGLTADFVWNFIEAPGFASLPVPSHRFWMPLATVVQAFGIAVIGPLVGDFRAAQLAIVAVAAFIPLLSYRAARSLGAGETAALVAAALTGLGGLFAPAWVATDSFAVAAVLGTLFFLSFGRAAATGSARDGAVAGALVGLLYLARAEAALFGLALLLLMRRPATRSAGTTGSAVALAIGTAWLARNALLGVPDLLARTVLLVRYEDFFAVAPPTVQSFLSAFGTALADRLSALATNLGVLLFTFLLLLAPFVATAAWNMRARTDVRAWSSLLLLVYLAQSLVWTEHSVRGSFSHSIAAFFPFGIALGVLGASRALATRALSEARLATAGMLVGSAVLSAFAVVQWDAGFGAAHRARAAALDAIPAGPLLAIDGAAWRTIAGRPAMVTPADGLDVAACAVARYRVRSVVLEVAHFRAYDALYRGEERPSWLGPPIERGTIRVFPVIGEIVCPIVR